MAIWERNHDKFLKYLNGNERRIQWTKEMEKDRMLPFLNMKMTGVKTRYRLGFTGNQATLSSIHHKTQTDQEMNKLGF